MATPDLLTRLRGNGPDLLTRIRGELDARLRELRPLLAEYEHLLVAASALDEAGEDGEDKPALTGAPAAARGRAGRPRARIARPAGGAAKPAVSASASAAPPDVVPASATPVRRRGRPPGRPISDRSADGGAGRGASSSAPRRTGGAPKPAAQRAQRGATGVAILAALEHGSHTASELVIVTAISGPIIQNNLRRLQQAGAITRTKRTGDGKAAYALSSTPA